MANTTRKTVSHEFGLSNHLHTPYTLALLECGHHALVCEGKHDASNMKSEYPCESCGDIEAKRAELLAVKANHNIHHTRARSFCGNYYITVYALDKTSPSNFTSVASYPDIPELRDIFTGSLAPLSPSERA